MGIAGTPSTVTLAGTGSVRSCPAATAAASKAHTSPAMFLRITAPQLTEIRADLDYSANFPGDRSVQCRAGSRDHAARDRSRHGGGPWMRIVIAGGTGFLGSPLAETYAEDGHDVRVLTRSLPSGESRHESGTGVPGITSVGWRPDGQAGRWAEVI